MVPADLLRSLTDSAGVHPLEWAAAPLRNAERVLQVYGDALSLHVGSDETVLQGSPSAISLPSNAVDGVQLLFTLPRTSRLDAVFAELRRILRPGATLVVLVPSASARTLTELRMSGLLADVHRGWTNRSGLDRAGWILVAADFAVLSDDRRSFTLPLPDAATAFELAAALPRAGIWPDDIAPDVPDRLAARAAPGRVLPVPLRRLVARR